MTTKNRKQYGFSLTLICTFLALIAVVGLIIWLVFIKPPSNGFVEWSFNGQDWTPRSAAPTCENPLAIGAPMDVSKATSKLYPGQVRGTDFKPHGGLAVDTATDNQLAVYAIRDAYLYQGSRYIEDGVVQYLLDFMDSCGVMYRYDHLAALSNEFAVYANQLPEPKSDDSRTQRFNAHPLVRQGTVIATAVGKNDNVGFDLGVYDLRAQNKASKTEIYKTDSRRISDKEQSFYSVCWFDLLPEHEKAVVAALSSRSGTEGTSSDYCVLPQ